MQFKENSGEGKKRTKTEQANWREREYGTFLNVSVRIAYYDMLTEFFFSITYEKVAQVILMSKC